MGNVTREEYTVGWVCVVGCELNAARAMLDEEHEELPSKNNDNNIYYLGRIHKHNVVITCLPDYGTNWPGITVVKMKEAFRKIRFGLLVGVAGGAPKPPHEDPRKDIMLGDVVVSWPQGKHSGVVHYDKGKMHEENYEICPYLKPPPSLLRNGVKAVKSDHEMHGPRRMHRYMEEGTHRYQYTDEIPTFPGRDNDQLFEASYKHSAKDRPCSSSCDPRRTVKRKTRKSNYPEVHRGLIASGNSVMRNAKRRDDLRDQEGVACFEMEAAGIMNIDEFPCLVIRGICDYSDSHKQKAWQPYAALTAAAYAKELLRKITPTKVEQELPVVDVGSNSVSSDQKPAPGTPDYNYHPSYDTGQYYPYDQAGPSLGPSFPLPDYNPSWGNSMASNQYSYHTGYPSYDDDINHLQASNIPYTRGVLQDWRELPQHPDWSQVCPYTFTVMHSHSTYLEVVLRWSQTGYLEIWCDDAMIGDSDKITPYSNRGGQSGRGFFFIPPGQHTIGIASTADQSGIATHQEWNRGYYRIHYA